MKKNGFIAISLIYSFFLVFLMTLLTVVANYMHNRILLNDVKKSIQQNLNNKFEFNSPFLEFSPYAKNEQINYANDTWIVLKNNGDSCVLMLARALTNEELRANLDSKYTSAISGNTMLMCYTQYDPRVCSYEGPRIEQYNLYYWDNSLVRLVVDSWFYNNAALQKASANDALVNMTFRTHSVDSSTYIRIPANNEYTALNNRYWNYTYFTDENGKSILTVNGRSAYASQTRLEVHPVIEVKKKSR